LHCCTLKSDGYLLSSTPRLYAGREQIDWHHATFPVNEKGELLVWLRHTLVRQLPNKDGVTAPFKGDMPRSGTRCIVPCYTAKLAQKKQPRWIHEQSVH